MAVNTYGDPGADPADEWIRPRQGDPTMSTPEPVSVALARQMPWTVAEQESVWLASGRISPKSSFSDCLIYALPHYVTEGQVMFVFIGALSAERDLIVPSMITHARELILTYAENPLVAHLERDQPAIDRALEEAR